MIKTRKQLLYRIRQIAYKHFHDTDSMKKITLPEGIPEDTFIFLDTCKIAEGVYDLLKEYESQYGSLPD